MTETSEVAFEVFPGVKAVLNASDTTAIQDELDALCKEYDVTRDDAVKSDNGRFCADMITILKSYGFKADVSAADTFDELKHIG